MSEVDKGKEVNPEFASWLENLKKETPPVSEVFNDQKWLFSIWQNNFEYTALENKTGHTRGKSPKDLIKVEVPTGKGPAKTFAENHNASVEHHRQVIDRLWSFYQVSKQITELSTPAGKSEAFSLDDATRKPKTPQADKEEKKDTEGLRKKIKVVNKDCLVHAEKIIKGASPKKKACVLNLANAYSCGGGVHHGASAQEEDIFRRTDADRCFEEFTNPRKNYYEKREYKDGGQLLLGSGCIHTSDVQVLRGPRTRDENSYKKLAEKDQFSISMITAAGCDLRYDSARSDSLVRNDKRVDYAEFYHKMKDKIRNLLYVAIQKGEKNLVLGAMSSGAFSSFEELSSDPKIPPLVTPGFTGYLVAHAFTDLLVKEGLAAHFDSVDFAITGSGNPHEVFSKVLSDKEGIRKEADATYAESLKSAGLKLKSGGGLERLSPKVGVEKSTPKNPPLVAEASLASSAAKANVFTVQLINEALTGLPNHKVNKVNDSSCDVVKGSQVVIKCEMGAGRINIPYASNPQEVAQCVGAIAKKLQKVFVLRLGNNTEDDFAYFKREENKAEREEFIKHIAELLVKADPSVINSKDFIAAVKQYDMDMYNKIMPKYSLKTISSLGESLMAGAKTAGAVSAPSMASSPILHEATNFEASLVKTLSNPISTDINEEEKKKKSFQDLLGGWTSDHTPQGLKLVAGDVEVRGETFNLADKCESAGSAAARLKIDLTQAHKNNPFNIDETAEQYLERKAKQLDYLIERINAAKNSGTPLDFMCLQEIDILYKKADKLGITGEQIGKLNELREKFKKVLKDAGWEMVLSTDAIKTSGGKPSQQPLAILYNRDSLTLDPPAKDNQPGGDPKGILPREVKGGTQNRGFALRFKKKGKEGPPQPITVACLHLAFEEESHSQAIAEFKEKEAAQDRIVMCAGDMNAARNTGKKRFPGLLGHWAYPTNLDSPDGKNLTDKHDVAGHIKRYDGFMCAIPEALKQKKYYAEEMPGAYFGREGECVGQRSSKDTSGLTGAFQVMELDPAKAYPHFIHKNLDPGVEKDKKSPKVE